MNTQQRNVSLDCFRGIFAIIVAIGHFYFFAQMRDVMPSSFVLAVDFFFVLSGFVLAKSIFRSKADGNIWLASFIEKRIYRIFPVFFFAVLIEIATRKFFGQSVLPTAFDIFRVSTLTQLFPFKTTSTFALTTNYIGWSISAEFWAGLIFFPVIFAMRNKYKFLLIPALTISAIWLVAAMSVYSPSYMDVHFKKMGEVPYGFIRVIIGFSLGAIIATTDAAKSLSSIKASVIQVLSVAAMIYMYASTNYNRENDYIAPFLFALFIFSLSSNKGVVCQATRNMVGDFLGKVSYPAYLIHPTVLIVYRQMGWQVNEPLQLLSYLAIVLVMSYVIHITVEQRFIDYISAKQRSARTEKPQETTPGEDAKSIV